MKPFLNSLYEKKEKKYNSDKLNKLYWIVGIAIFMLIVVFSTYFIHFNDFISPKNEDWGTFGDFVGGTLNPIFAFLSLMAIIYTIKIQTQELEYSREELEETRNELTQSRIAQQEQSESLKLQNDATKLQSFENTFFKLFDLFNLTKNTLNSKVIIKNQGDIRLLGITVDGIFYHMNSKFLHFWKKYEGLNSGNKAIELFLYILKECYNSDYDDFNIVYEKNTSAYFGQIYQILKFVNNSDIKNKQRYINIFRAQFTKNELEFLFYHCLGSIGKIKFKLLVEEFEFFEHVIHSDDIDKPLTEYDIKAFGKNKTILDVYNRR